MGLSVAGTHFRYLTKWEKKKLNQHYFYIKDPPFCCDAFLDSAAKSGKVKNGLSFSLIDYVHSMAADSKLKILGW